MRVGLMVAGRVRGGGRGARRLRAPAAPRRPGWRSASSPCRSCSPRRSPAVSLGALVAVATLMLWSGPARDWFAGRPVRQLEPAAREPGTGSGPAGVQSVARCRERTTHPGPRTPRPRPRPAAELADAPGSRRLGAGSDGRAAHPAASSRPRRLLHPAAGDQRVRPASHRPRRAPGRGLGRRRTPPSSRGSAVPVTVKVACILTWVFAGVVALLYAGLLVALVVAQDRIVDYVVEVPGVAARQPRPGRDPARPVGRLPDVPRLGAGCLRARLVHLAPAQLGPLAAGRRAPRRRWSRRCSRSRSGCCTSSRPR